MRHESVSRYFTWEHLWQAGRRRQFSKELLVTLIWKLQLIRAAVFLLKIIYFIFWNYSYTISLFPSLPSSLTIYPSLVFFKYIHFLFLPLSVLSYTCTPKHTHTQIYYTFIVYIKAYMHTQVYVCELLHKYISLYNVICMYVSMFSGLAIWYWIISWYSVV